MKKFANLPVEYVFRTLGIGMRQSRDVEVISFSCRLGCAGGDCSSCPFSRSTTIRGYSDSFEEGRANTLKSAAVRLYILLFFYTDSEGHIDDADYKEIGEFLGVCGKTVKASLCSLRRAGFLSGYEKKNARRFSADIADYKTMYYVGPKNGKGYVTFSREMMREITKVRGINELRLVVKVILNALYNQRKSASKTAATRISFGELRKSLPAYVKPHVLRDAVEKTMSFFRSAREGYKEFILVLGEDFQAARVKEKLKEEGKAVILGYIRKLDSLTDTLGRDIEETGHPSYATLSSFGSEGIRVNEMQGKAGAVPLNSKQRNDVISLCPEFGVDMVIGALRAFYQEYVLKNIRIENPGGLIRKILNEKMEYGLET